MAERLSNGATPIHRFLFAPVTVKRAVKVSLLIGTLLILINQGDLILAGGAPASWKVLLTYLVPYGVSSYSTAALLRDTARAGE